MSTRYVTCAPLRILGAFVVASQAFSSRLIGWVAFGVAIGIVAIVLLSKFDRGRGVCNQCWTWA
jgi:hypothetical protein